MHLLFLGNAKSNWKLTHEWPGASKNGLRKAMNPLLKEIKRFNLSWFHAQPFGGNPNKLTTGSWVSENWLAFTRISKYAASYCSRSAKKKAAGFDDVIRLHVCFTMLVARLLSHSGMDENMILEIENCIKEFLSCVNELDLQVRPRSTPKDDSWWMKLNYVSLLNLLDQIRLFGPLIHRHFTFHKIIT